MGFGCVLRDHSSKVIRAIYDPLGVCDFISVEVMSLLMGLRELKRLDVSGCMAEGDSEVVISWGLGQGPSSWCHSSCMKFGELVVVMLISLHCVPRC